MDDLTGALNMFNNSLMNAVNVAFASQTRRQDRKFTREMFDKQTQVARENWQMMNEYNSPSAQMERLEAAGLNPNLVYGSGGVTGTTSLPQSSSFNGGYSTPPKFEVRGLQDYLALSNYQKNMEVADAQIDKSRAETSNILADRNLKESQTGLNNIELYIADQLKDVRISQKNADLWRTQFDNDVLAKYGMERAQLEISKAIASIGRIAQENSLTSRQIEAIAHDIAVKDATVSKIVADTQVSYAAADNIYDEIVSRAIHDELGVAKQQLSPFGNSSLGSILNGIYNVNFYDGKIYRTVSDALDRLLQRSHSRGVGDTHTVVKMPVVKSSGQNHRVYRKFKR